MIEDNIIPIIVAIIAGIPGVVAIIIAYNERKKTEKVDMVHDFIELLRVTCTFDLVLQEVFIRNPEINGELKKKWVRASARLSALREKTKA